MLSSYGWVGMAIITAICECRAGYMCKLGDIFVICNHLLFTLLLHIIMVMRLQNVYTHMHNCHFYFVILCVQPISINLPLFI